MLCVQAPMCLWGQSSDNIHKWKSIIATKELPEIAQLIGHSDSLPWPKLTSNSAAGVTGKASDRPSDLGIALLDKIRAYEKTTPEDEKDSEEAASVYNNLSVGLQKSGGYINLCLADAANRLAVARLSKLLINNPALVNEVKASADSLQCISFSAPRFVQMLQDESSAGFPSMLDVAHLDAKNAKKQIYAALGTTQDQIDYQFINNQAGTSVIINNVNIGVLLERLGETEAVDQCFLAALIDFVEHGGQYKDIRLNDVRPFRAIMQGREQLYKSDLLGINHTHAGIIMTVMKQFQKDDSNNVFILIALQ